MNMKLWIDDMRPAPKGYVWCKSVNEAINTFFAYTASYVGGNENHKITLIDLDHDAGSFAVDGGDYVKFLDWLEENSENFHGYIPPIRIHSMNPVGVQNMRQIIRKNNWKEVL
jgi:hypothetical protein